MTLTTRVIRTNLITNPRGRTTAGGITTRRNLAFQPRAGDSAPWMASGSTTLTVVQGVDPFGQQNEFTRCTNSVTSSQGPYYRELVGRVSGQAGAWLAMSAWLRPVGQDMHLRADPQPRSGTTSVGGRSGDFEWYEADQWHQIVEPVQATADFDNWQYWVRVNDAEDETDITLDMTCLMLVVADTEAAARAAVQTYFDGDTWDGDPDLIPEWDGTPHASPSRLVLPNSVGWSGEGIYYSTRRDAVFIPAGVQATPPGALPAGARATLVVQEQDRDIRERITGPLHIPAVGRDRYVRVAAWR